MRKFAVNMLALQKKCLKKFFRENKNLWVKNGDSLKIRRALKKESVKVK